MTIYCIYNHLHDKAYVGQTSQAIEERYRQHLCLQEFTRKNKKMFEDFQKFDEHFEMIILQHIEDHCDSNIVYEIEEYWINKKIVEGYETYNIDGVKDDPEAFVEEMERKYGNTLLDPNYVSEEDQDSLLDGDVILDLETNKSYERIVDAFTDTGVSRYAIKRSCIGSFQEGRFIYLKDYNGQGYKEYDILKNNSVFESKEKARLTCVYSEITNRLYANHEACSLGDNVKLATLRKFIKKEKGYKVIDQQQVPSHLLYHPNKSSQQLEEDKEMVLKLFQEQILIKPEVKEPQLIFKKEEDGPINYHKEFILFVLYVRRHYGDQAAYQLLHKYQNLI